MIWVIEPHVDDAFLSLHEHMIRWIKSGDAVTILAVYSNPRRDKEGEVYAKSIGASFRSLTIQEQSHLGQPAMPIPPFKDWQVSTSASSQIIFPLGLQHPDHVQVRSQAPVGSWFYFDTPYQSKQKLAEELLVMVEGQRLVSIRYPGKLKWRHIATFKSQAKFFHFNPVERLWHLPEILIRSP
jgi:hypothetical protein